MSDVTFPHLCSKSLHPPALVSAVPLQPQGRPSGGEASYRMSSTGGYVLGAQERGRREGHSHYLLEERAAQPQLSWRIPLSLLRLRSAERDIPLPSACTPLPLSLPNWGIRGCTRMAQMGVGAQGRKPVGAPPSSSGKHREQMTCSSCPGARLQPCRQSSRDKSLGCLHGFRNTDLGPKGGLDNSGPPGCWET